MDCRNCCSKVKEFDDEWSCCGWAEDRKRSCCCCAHDVNGKVIVTVDRTIAAAAVLTRSATIGRLFETRCFSLIVPSGQSCLMKLDGQDQAEANPNPIKNTIQRLLNRDVINDWWLA